MYVSRRGEHPPGSKNEKARGTKGEAHDLHHEDDPAVTADGALLQRHPESLHGTGTQLSNQDGAAARAPAQLGQVEYMMASKPRPLPNREAVFLDYLSDIGYNRNWKEANGDDKSVLG